MKQLLLFEDRFFEYIYIEVDDTFLCELQDGSLGWSKHIIDAKDFETAEEATKFANANEIWFFGLHFCSRPPAAFLYTNPYLPPKERRIRLHTESHLDYLRRLGLAYP